MLLAKIVAQPQGLESVVKETRAARQMSYSSKHLAVAFMRGECGFILNWTAQRFRLSACGGRRHTMRRPAGSCGALHLIFAYSRRMTSRLQLSTVLKETKYELWFHIRIAPSSQHRHKQHALKRKKTTQTHTHTHTHTTMTNQMIKTSCSRAITIIFGQKRKPRMD